MVMEQIRIGQFIKFTMHNNRRL